MAEAHEAMAQVWRDWGMPALGLSSAHRAVFYAPRSASAHNTLGTLLDALGQPDAAAESYRQAIVLSPAAGWALNNLCYLEFRRGRLPEAQASCEAALRATPQLAAAHNNLALAYAAAGDLGRAATEFDAVGDAATSAFNLGIVYVAMGENDLALAAFVRAIEARPSFVEAKQHAHTAALRVLFSK